MNKHLLAGAIVAALALIQAGPLTQGALAAENTAENTTEAAKANWYHTLVDSAFVAQHAVLPKPDGVLIIDSRPAARKYDPGHIPTALNIPDTQFDKHVDKLPQDRNTLLIFYCDGVECMLSHKSAFKAEQLGYTRVRVYAAGYPDWIANGHMGAISVPYLKKLMDEGAPMTLIDSRPKERKYDKGHIPGAVSLPDSQFDKLVDRPGLPQLRVHHQSSSSSSSVTAKPSSAARNSSDVAASSRLVLMLVLMDLSSRMRLSAMWRTSARLWAMCPMRPRA